MKDYQYFLFDLDGTVTDPGEGITNSVMYALQKFGIHERDRRKLYRFIGPPAGRFLPGVLWIFGGRGEKRDQVLPGILQQKRNI